MRTRQRFVIISLLVVSLGVLGFWLTSDFFGETYSRRPVHTGQKEDSKKSDRTVKNATITGDPSLAYNGYTLLSLQFSTNVYLIDMDGHIVHRWSAPFHDVWPDAAHVHKVSRARIFVETAHVYPNGDLLVQYSGLGDTPYGYGIAKIDKDSNVLWAYGENAHHDFSIRESDGHIFALTQSVIRSALPGLDTLQYPLLNDYVVELSPEGKELQKISVAEAFTDTPYQYLLFTNDKKGKKGWDLLHTNSVMALDESIADNFPMFGEGDILLSIRNKNLLVIIDAKSHKVSHVYEGKWQNQHSASFLENGHLMVLDNKGMASAHRRGPKSNQSRVIEISPETSEIVWNFSGNHQHPFKTPSRGRVERLPNGNTLIAESIVGRAFEVTKDGEIAWQIQFPKKEDAKRRNKVTKLWIVTAKRYTPDLVPFLEEKE
jgi:hypothetical protein